MHQLINMYQPMFRRQPKILSATTLLAIIGIVMALMLGLYSNAHSNMQRLQRTSTELTTNYSKLQAQLSVAANNAEFSTNAVISDEITALQAQIDDRKALVERINQLFIDADDGFSEIFETLAQTNLPNLWLTGVELNQNGSVEISGTALDAMLVPQYMQLITQASSLASLNSGTVELTRDDQHLEEVNFVLSYNTAGEQQ